MNDAGSKSDAVGSAPTMPWLQQVLLAGLILIALRLASHIPMPGINLALVRESMPGAIERLSIVALGSLPWLSAVSFAELFALVWPCSPISRFMKEGHINPFSRLVIAFALVLTIVQAFGIAEALTATQGLLADSDETLILVIASLTGGTALTIGLARLIAQLGITISFWILLACSTLVDMPRELLLNYEIISLTEMSLSQIGVKFLAPCVVVLLTIAALQSCKSKNVTNIGTTIWPILLGPLISSIIIALAILILLFFSQQESVEWINNINYFPVGFLLDALIGSLVAARYSSLNGRLDILPVILLLVISISLLNILAWSLSTQPILGGSQIVIVTAVSWWLTEHFKLRSRWAGLPVET